MSGGQSRALLMQALRYLRRQLEADIEGGARLIRVYPDRIVPIWQELEQATHEYIFELAALCCDIEDELATSRICGPDWLDEFLLDFRSGRAGATS